MLPVMKRPASAAVQDASLPLDRTTLRKFTQGQSRTAGTWLAVRLSSGGHPPVIIGIVQGPQGGNASAPVLFLSERG
jgi:hypothetical protein